MPPYRPAALRAHCQPLRFCPDTDIPGHTAVNVSEPTNQPPSRLPAGTPRRYRGSTVHFQRDEMFASLRSGQRLTTAFGWLTFDTWHTRWTE